MALNNISTEIAGDGSDPVATKLLRRDDKLALAATKRQATGTTGYRPLNQIVGTHQAYVAGILSTVSGTGADVIGHPWSSGPTVPGPFTLNWYGTVSQPIATTGTYATDNGGITLHPDSYIDVGSTLQGTTFTITLDANLGLGWTGNRWNAIWANEVYDTGRGIHCYWDSSTYVDIGSPNHEVEFATPNITDNQRRLYTFVVEDTTILFYINGSLIGSNNIPSFILPVGSNFYIGARHSGDGSGYTDSQGGTYFSLKVESAALTGQQVADAYTAWLATL